MTSDACIIIPARYASTRYPGKPLATLKGARGTVRSLLERSVMAGRKAIEEAGGEISLYVARPTTTASPTRPPASAPR